LIDERVFDIPSVPIVPNYILGLDVFFLVIGFEDDGAARRNGAVIVVMGAGRHHVLDVGDVLGVRHERTEGSGLHRNGLGHDCRSLSPKQSLEMFDGLLNRSAESLSSM
jgi:hypothetical protein